MSEHEVTEYLRAVEGRLARVEEGLQHSRTDRATLRADVMEVKAAIASNSHHMDKWQRQIEVSMASRSWIDKLIWAVMSALAASAWWNWPLGR